MSDENYKRVVLKYLLGKFNLQNLNYKGYIGEIEKRDNYDNERNHKIVNGELTHIIDDSYVLRYKSEDLSAVSEYEDSKDNINSKQATVKDFRNLQNTKKLKGEAR